MASINNNPIIEVLDVKVINQIGGTTGSLKDSDGSNIKCDAKVAFKIGSTTYYLAAYDTLN